MTLGRVRLGNKGGGATGAISNVLAPTVNIPDLNVAIDSLEDDRQKKVVDTNADVDAKIEKSSQFEDYVGENTHDYDEEDGDEDGDDGEENETSQEVNLNFYAMLYSSKHRVVNPDGSRDWRKRLFPILQILISKIL